jgi:16S rRNA (cytosine1402-N4)-methyltransferase
MAQTPASTPPPGRYHQPVMVAEVVDFFTPIESGLIVDATFGGGGHTEALLAALPNVSVLALDRDPDATSRVPVGTRIRLVTANFGDLARMLADPETMRWRREHGARDPDGDHVAGVLFDLGVSSHQLDRAGRGFSYHREGPLDMRMGPDASLTAADIVNRYDVDRLTSILRRFGEEPHARRIAQSIVRNRPLATTTELAAVVAAAVPGAARRRRHPARRVFQAIRIAVNDELTAVARGLDAAVAALRPGGRIVVIAYHSLEDRIVKRRFAAGSQGCVCPPELPVCVCDNVVELRRLTRSPLRPGDTEVAQNPRARSARLRAAEKVAA